MRKRIPLKPQEPRKKPLLLTRKQVRSKAPAAGVTVLERINRYVSGHKAAGGPPLKYADRAVRQEIGARVRDAFFSVPKRYAGKREVDEGDGVYTVLVYPFYYRAEIDKIIHNYFL